MQQRLTLLKQPQFIVCLVSILMVLSFLLSSKPLIAEEAPTAASFFDDSFNNMQEEIEIAKEDEKKALLLMFEMDECPFCHRMKQTILNQPEVLAFYRDNFRIISIDIEGDLELIDFEGNSTTQKDFSLQQHRVRATPVFMFFDLEGKPLKRGRFTGAAKDAQEFLLLGQFITEKHNETVSFIKYKKELNNSKP